MNTDTFKQKLEEELRTLRQEIGENTRAPRQEDPTATESDELADKIEDLQEERGENAALQNRLAEVEAALDRIERGSYGACEVCGKAIEEERLTADPAARTCMEHIAA